MITRLKHRKWSCLLDHHSLKLVFWKETAITSYIEFERSSPSWWSFWISRGELNVAQEELNIFLGIAEELKVKWLSQNNSNKPNSLKPKEIPCKNDDDSTAPKKVNLYKQTPSEKPPSNPLIIPLMMMTCEKFFQVNWSRSASWRHPYAVQKGTQLQSQSPMQQEHLPSAHLARAQYGRQ